MLCASMPENSHARRLGLAAAAAARRNVQAKERRAAAQGAQLAQQGEAARKECDTLRSRLAEEIAARQRAADEVRAAEPLLQSSSMRRMAFAQAAADGERRSAALRTAEAALERERGQTAALRVRALQCAAFARQLYSATAQDALGASERRASEAEAKAQSQGRTACRSDLRAPPCVPSLSVVRCAHSGTELDELRRAAEKAAQRERLLREELQQMQTVRAHRCAAACPR